MKNCQDFKDMISEYVDDELKGDSLHELEEHINKCSECKKDLEDVKTLISYFRKAPEEDLPLDFKESLHKKLLAESNSNKGSSQRVRFIRKYMPICAVAASVLLVFAFWMNFKGMFKMGSSLEKSADSGMVYQLEADSANGTLAGKKDSKDEKDLKTGNYDGAKKYGSEENDSNMDFGRSYKDNENYDAANFKYNEEKAANYSASQSIEKKKSTQSEKIEIFDKSVQSQKNTNSVKGSTPEKSPSVKDAKRNVNSINIGNVVAKTASVIITETGGNTVDDIRNIALSYGAVEKHPDVMTIVGERTNGNTDVSLPKTSESNSYSATLQKPTVNKEDEPVANDSTSSVDLKSVADSTQLSFSIPNDRYSEFIEKIKEKYGASNIKISTPVNIDNTKAVNSLNIQIDSLKEQLDITSKNVTGISNTNDEKIKTRIEELEKQKNEIITSSNCTTVIIMIKK